MAAKKGYNVTKTQILEYLKQGIRSDGRKPFDLRNIDIRTNVSVNAEGSVIVKMGKTEVACGIKMGVSTPYTDHENEGTMMTSMELLPLSSPDFEYGPPRIASIEPARIIDRGIRESGFIDFKGLCIEEGEKVWSIFVDLVTLNDDGNILDAGALAAVIALRIAKMPQYDEETGRIINYGHFTDKGLPLVEDKMPITLTFRKVGDNIIIDPTKAEEEASSGRLSIEISNPKDSKELIINAMQKGQVSTVSIDDVEEMLKQAEKLFKNIDDLISKEVKKANK